MDDDIVELWELSPHALHSAGPDGILRRVNATWLRLLGYTREEVVGKLHFMAMLTPESQASHQRRRLGMLARGGTEQTEFTMVRKDGSSFTALVSTRLYVDADGRFARSNTAFIDISERKRGEDQLRRLIDAAPDAIVLVHPDGTVAYANQQIERLFGHTSNQLVGQSVALLVPESARAAHGDHLLRFMAAPQVRPMSPGHELHGRRRDGSEFPIEVTLSLIEAEGAALVAASIRDISERRQAERIIGRLAAIVDTSQDAIFSCDPAGTITSWNSAAERLYGYSAPEAIGRSMTMLIPDDPSASGSHAIDVRSASASNFETKAIDKHGRIFYVNITISQIPGPDGASLGTSTVARDISRRKRAEAAARLANDRLAEAIECIDDAFAIFDGDGRLALHNSAHQALLDATVEGPQLGRTARSLGPAHAVEPTRPDQPRLVHDLDLGGRVYHRTIRRTHDGGSVVLLSDRTEERQREAALRKASAAKSDFLSSMSHELRTPLNAVLGFAQLLQRDRRAPLTPRQLGMVEHIVKGGEHLLRLIDEVLDLARVETGRVSIKLEPVDLDGVVDAAIATLAPLAARAGVELAFEARGDVPRVLADRTRLAQIAMNLGSNAIKYTRRGGRATFITAAQDPQHARLTVADTGIGVPLAEQDRIFQPFHRAGQESGPIEGTGIGLAITRRLAELMQGAVGFHSVPGEGSRFWVDLPIADDEPAPAAPSRTGADASLDDGPRRRIVYIEDHPANIAFMQALMADIPGVELLTAPTAEIGLEMVRTHLPHVVILDINLPGMNGFEALRRLRQWPETRDIPAIALSAAAMDHDIRRARDAGFFRYLTKPVQVEALIDALREVLPAS